MKSVIMQVDESTKGLMEEIQSGISSSIEESIRDVKSTVESVGDNTDMILRKFKNFDSVSSSIVQLRSLADESKKFAAMASPLQSSMADIKQVTKTNEKALSQQAENLNLLMSNVSNLEEKQDTVFCDIKKALTELKGHYTELSEKQSQQIIEGLESKLSTMETSLQQDMANIRTVISDVNRSVGCVKDDLIENVQKLEESIGRVVTEQKNFGTSYAAHESAHVEFENNATMQFKQLGESVEKLQATLDIVVNLVTPFWKKW